MLALRFRAASLRSQSLSRGNGRHRTGARGGCEPGYRSHFSLRLMSVGDEISDACRISCGELGSGVSRFFHTHGAVSPAGGFYRGAFAEGIKLSFGSMDACADAQLFLSITSAVTEFGGVLVTRIVMPIASLHAGCCGAKRKTGRLTARFLCRSVGSDRRPPTAVRGMREGDVRRTEHFQSQPPSGNAHRNPSPVVCRGVAKIFDLNLERSVPGSGWRRALPRTKPPGGSTVGAPPCTRRIPPARLK